MPSYSGIERLGLPGGLPRPFNASGRSFDRNDGSIIQDTLWDLAANEENTVANAVLVSDGPTMAGDGILNVSIYASGCGKSTNQVRFYRDATRLYDNNESIGGSDNQSGALATASVVIPAWPRAAVYRWVWASNCQQSFGVGNSNAWGWYSNRQRIWVPPRRNPVWGLG